MSWFTDIAGRAEDLLNKIDKNAAVALNTSSPKAIKESRPKKLEPFIEPSEGESNHSIRTVPNLDNPPTFASTPTENSSSNVVGNSFNSVSSSSSRNKGSTNSTKRQSRSASSSSARTSANHVENSSISSAKVNLSQTVINQNGVATKQSTSVNSSTSSVQDVQATEDDLIAYLNSSDHSEGLNESLILKDEVETQARELKLLTKNHRSLQKDYEELKRKLEIYQEKLVRSETARDSNEAEERDLRKLLDNKESEIRDLSSRHQQALEALQKLELSQDNLQKLEQCLLENAQLKSENESLQQRSDVLASQVETTENHVLSLKSTLASMEKEFTNYKEKAKSILTYKDDLISSLKSDTGAGSNIEGSSNPAEELLAEITALKNERELLHAEISQTRAIVDSFKDDNIRLEKEVSTLRYYSEDLSGQLKVEKETVASLQSENLQVCQQLNSLQFELERERNERKKCEDLVTQYKEANSRTSSTHVMSQSNGHVVGNAFVGTDQQEISKLKTRVSALSQSLYEKQSLINDLSTDKQLLQIEIERLKNDLRDCRVENNEFCHSGLPQTVIASQPLYLSESPWDSRVSARMKRIYTQLDAVFCQFGLALRKRPNLRLGMSLYVIFLHLWVFFVLFSWMHHAVPEPKNATLIIPHLHAVEHDLAL